MTENSNITDDRLMEILDESLRDLYKLKPDVSKKELIDKLKKWANDNGAKVSKMTKKDAGFADAWAFVEPGATRGFIYSLDDLVEKLGLS